MIAPRAPFPADYGAAQRNLQLLRWLGSRHDVTLLTFGESGDRHSRDVLQQYATRIEIVSPPRRSRVDRARTFAFSREPDLARRLGSAELNRRLAALLRDNAYDLVQIEGLEMFEAWATARPALSQKPRVILDAHNAEYILQDSAWRSSLRQRAPISTAYSLVQATRLRRFEQQACRSVDGVVDVSPEEDAVFRDLAPGIRTAVVPNGVDLDHYDFVDDAAARSNVLFIGKLDYRPNVDAVEWLGAEIWPLVRQRFPTATLHVVGRDPLPPVRRLGNDAGLIVVGPVDDERAWFRQAAILAVPMRMGGGVRLKVLQALAMGTPVVSTSFGMSGVGAIDGVHYLRADSAPDFAGKLAQLLGDSALRSRLAAAGRLLVRERFDWRVIMPRLDEFHRAVLGGF